MKITVHSKIVSAILDAIALPDYKPPIPHLDSVTWHKILHWKEYERRNNFFEWLGDSLVYAAISVELCRQVPHGAEGIFTGVRSALASNMTFNHLTRKMGMLSDLQQWHGRSTSSKLFADFFEVVTAEVYRKFGFEVLCEWVRDVFSPLITAALLAYNRIQRQSLKMNTARKFTCLNRAMKRRTMIYHRSFDHAAVFKPKDHTRNLLARKTKSLFSVQTPVLPPEKPAVRSRLVPHTRAKMRFPLSASLLGNQFGMGAGTSASNPIIIDDDDDDYDDDPVIADEAVSGSKTLGAASVGDGGSSSLSFHSAVHEVVIIDDD